MKINARDDIDAPAEAVFRSLLNFDHWERAALRRGVDVVRTDDGTPTGAGTSWRIGFAYRGRPRTLAVRLGRVEAGHALLFEGLSPSFEGTLMIDVVPLGPRRTRVSATLDVLPRTIASRLFLQSLRLARKRVVTRFQSAIGALATLIEDRYRSGAG